jgi:hypothetical protein
MTIADPKRIQHDIETLSPESLSELSEFIIYLRFKEQHRKQHGSPWLKDLYDVFAPVREAVEQSGMTEEEVNDIIDDAIAEVRRERKS